ncbi:MAG: hypothetical protein RML15_06260 [Bacteroidota bacterium]|nr:hypothetical protein [Candidatus Kapabacteria bacterium]MCS7303415.1 hypothetical protein [Candidatus Kapabacteria bacterium]MCX7937450.1 hypothetical protein [Chlorobiota bacterium]MDW8075116.1 hypothetical protein [Bacteroidota bacterium]MDW8271995.1 hypothetical protein [Bacteroidota bacterium]
MRLRALIALFILTAFAIYSQSLLVMWCLYFLEQHDIVLYFCPEDLGSNHPFAGARFVHELSDAHKGKAQGALVLLKVVERTTAYVHATIDFDIRLSIWRLCGWVSSSGQILEGYPLSLFIPPRSVEHSFCF